MAPARERLPASGPPDQPRRQEISPFPLQRERGSGIPPARVPVFATLTRCILPDSEEIALCIKAPTLRFIGPGRPIMRNERTSGGDAAS